MLCLTSLFILGDRHKNFIDMIQSEKDIQETAQLEMILIRENSSFISVSNQKMDEHLNKVNAASKVHKNNSERSQDNMNKSEISSLLYKASSEFGTTFADSAYGSLGHSAYSSLRPLHSSYTTKNASSKASPAPPALGAQ